MMTRPASSRAIRGPRRHVVGAALALLFVMTPSGGRAQDASAPPTEAASAEARVHFERGIALFNEGRLDAALAEFQRAYEVAPAYPVLYNVGRVQAELGRPVESARAFERYLSEGGEGIDRARRAEVEALLSRQLERIGRVRVETNVPGSIVSVDGVDVATTPIEPGVTAPSVEVGAGRHMVGVRAPGYESVALAIDLAGGVEERIAVDLRPEVAPRGSLRITATLAGLVVRVDGAEVGRTPLDATIPVPAGEHDIVGSRAGYLDDVRHIWVDDGAELEVRLDPEVDPDPDPGDVGTLALALPDGRLTARIDGAYRSVLEPTVLPIGVHALEIDAEDRERWAVEVEIAPREVLRLTPLLTWTDRARRERLSSAATGRTVGTTLTIGGAAILVAGLAVAIWNEMEIARTDTRIIVLGTDYTATCTAPGTGGPRCEGLASELNMLMGHQGEQNAIRAVSITAAVVGAALGAIGITLLVLTPSDTSVDESAHAELRIGPSGLVVGGVF